MGKGVRILLHVRRLGRTWTLYLFGYGVHKLLFVAYVLLFVEFVIVHFASCILYPDLLEFHPGSCLSLRLSLKIGSRTKAEKSCNYTVWKRSKKGIIGLSGFIKSAPLDCDAVFRSLKLTLEFKEILICLELWIIFSHG